MSAVSLPDRVRAACAWVAGQARSVRVDEAAIPTYAATLGPPTPPPRRQPLADPAEREAAARFVLSLDAINFGSGWWPTIRRRPGLSGYSTVEAALRERFDSAGPWSAAQLAATDAAAIAAVLGQDPGHPLMADFAAALRDLGGHVGADHGGSFSALIDAAGSAATLAETLAAWDAFADASTYLDREVPFFKRAQIAASDLDRAGVAHFADLGRLTAFADNLVPQVLRLDGVLLLAPELTARIESGELLEHGSPEEVELRAGAVHAVELLAAASPPLRPAEIDSILWNRGRGRRYKERPRPRSRNTAY
jgi:hypothetical protein